MVRANRPWRLVPALSGAFAGALATGAYVLIGQQLWRLADALSPTRLTIASVFAVASMIVWVIVDHHLWERPSGRAARQLAVLYNTATTLTLTVGAFSLYAGLFALSLLAGAFLLPSRVLREALGHEVNWGDWVTIAWFVASVATVGGAMALAWRATKRYDRRRTATVSASAAGGRTRMSAHAGTSERRPVATLGRRCRVRR
jgi:hypothetical protein